MKFLKIAFLTVVEIAAHCVIRSIEYCRGIRNPKKVPPVAPRILRICETAFWICVCALAVITREIILFPGTIFNALRFLLRFLYSKLFRQESTPLSTG